MRPTDIPVLSDLAGRGGAITMTPELVATTTAMASRITIQVPGRSVSDQTSETVNHAMAVFHAVDRSCTRFCDDSDLMRANAQPTEWTTVDRWCYAALAEAHGAYVKTAGRFDPRVLDDLVRLGYARSFTLGGAEPRTSAEVRRRRGPLPPWRPEFRGVDSAVKLAGTVSSTPGATVDLGGIGKGLAVRWASQRLRDAGISDHLVEAGGDCYCSGRPTDGTHWRVGVEDPLGGDEPVAVLQVSDEAVTTSSVRLRHWRAGNADLHHIIDPATGQSGGEGLLAVTVVLPDAATAEVWAKVLFLAGADEIAATAQAHELPALWVDVQGALSVSSLLGDRLLWRRS